MEIAADSRRADNRGLTAWSKRRVWRAGCLHSTAMVIGQRGHRRGWKRSERGAAPQTLPVASAKRPVRRPSRREGGMGSGRTGPPRLSSRKTAGAVPYLPMPAKFSSTKVLEAMSSTAQQVRVASERSIWVGDAGGRARRSQACHARAAKKAS